MMHRFFQMMVFSVLLLATACKLATQPPQKFGGAWTMNLGDRTFLVLALTEIGDKVTGGLTRPANFQLDASGSRFSKITADEVTEPITSATIKDDLLRFSTGNPRDPNDTSEYELTITGHDMAALKFVDAPFDPWPLTRVANDGTATVYKGWDPRRFYPEHVNTPSNLAMQRIFEADQKPRQDPGALTSAQWDVLSRQDMERRKETAKLLADGQLHSGEDFNRAAFIFQHGSTPDDYLLAHTLAMIAVAKGDESALWIGTATLDRYLQSVGKPQIYGTQFKPGTDASQEPFNRNLINDALRREMGVPALATQMEQHKFVMEQFKDAKK